MINLLLNLSLLEWFSTLLFGVIIYLIIKYWMLRKQYPPGPLPLPLLGSLPAFMGKETGLNVVDNYRKIYGDVMTIWFGLKPFVIVSSWELMKEALINQKCFNARSQSILTDIICQGASDIAFTTNTPAWKVLRKIGLTAVRKYVSTDNLEELTREFSKETAGLMLKESDSFEPDNLVYSMISNVIATAALGGKLDRDNVKIFKEANDTASREAGNGLPGDFLPFLRPFYKHREERITQRIVQAHTLILEKLREHKLTYKHGEIRDFCDAVLASKFEADESEQQYLDDYNLKMVIANLYFAGTDTTQISLRWVLLYLINYPDVQERVYQEIKNEIGDRTAVQADKKNCPLTIAVISEVLRLRVVTPMAIPHMTEKSTELGGHLIPANTTVLFNLDAIHMDDKTWEDPEKFKPERFLEEDNTFTKKILTGYVPFSLGKRSCIGEKLAKADMFLCLVGLLQECKLVLDGKPGSSDFRPTEKFIISEPRPYKMKALPRI